MGGHVVARECKMTKGKPLKNGSGGGNRNNKNRRKCNNPPQKGNGSNSGK